MRTYCNRTYTGKRFYKKKEYDKGVPIKSSMHNNRRTHTGEKPYHVKSGATEMYSSVLIVGFSYEHTLKQDLSFIIDTYMKANARILTGEKPYVSK